MQQVLTLLGPTGSIHLDTERIDLSSIGGPISANWMFRITAQYDVPPISMTLEGKGLTLEAACGEITWQFLEQIGMTAL